MEASELFSVRAVFRPVYLLLALTGFVLPGLRPCRCSTVFKFTFCLCVCLMFIGVCINYFVDNLPRLLTLKKMDILILLILGFVKISQDTFLSVLLTYSACRHLGAFCKLLIEYCRENELPNRFVLLVIVSWVTSVIVFFGTVFVGLYAGVSEATCDLIPSSLTNWTSARAFLRCLSYDLTHLLMLTRAWIPVILYTFVWLVLLLEAKRLNQDVRRHDFKNTHAPASQIEHFRLRHLQLCNLIDKANAVFRHFLFTTYAGGIPVVLIALSVLVYSTQTAQYTTNIFYIITHSCLQLIFVTVTGAVLSLEMHKPTGILSSLRIEQMVGKPYNAIAAFQSQLQNGPIGFHVYRLFTIDTSTVLMISGTVVTYAVIAVQFKPCDSGATSRYDAQDRDVITNVTSFNTSHDGSP